MKGSLCCVLILAVLTHGQDDGCRPTTFYVFRHAERFIAAAGNAQDDSQEVLTPEGFQRARDLRQKFIDERLSLDAIYVSKEFVRSYQTAAPLEAEFQVPVHRYYAEAPASADLSDVIFASFPCPDSVAIVTHGDFIESVFTALGFDPTDVADITSFGKFFTLTDNNGILNIGEDTYGVEASDGDVPWTGPPVDTALLPGQCFPSTLYITRHAERFAAADGNGADDSQEILTDLGFQRARDLRQAFIDNDLPLDHIFVTLEYIRTLQTASPLEAHQGENAGLAPMTLYGVLQPNQVELIRRLNFLNPCPEHVLIVTHGDFLPNTFEALGINPDDVPGLDIAFGLLFTVTFEFEGFEQPTIETTSYGAQNDNPLPIPSDFPRRHPECQPSTFYIFRHAERFVANSGNGQDDSQEVLTSEGFQRSFALRDKFIDEGLPLDGIYVSREYVRSYLTIAPTEVEFQVPVHRYYAESPRDIVDQISSSFPCPEHAAIVTHGNFIVDVFAQLGFDASSIPGIADFGQFFTLSFDQQACLDCINIDTNHKKAWCSSTHQCLNIADSDVCSTFIQSASLCLSFAGARVEQSTYGVAESNDNVPWPQPAVAGLQTCQPTTFYIMRHVERFMSSDGNGADDSQEILTPEGFVRAEALKDKFDEEGLPVDHIFVTLEYIRTLATSAPTEAFEGMMLDGAPVTLYRALTPVQIDLRERISRLNPCPEHVMVVTHGFFIADVFTSLGFDPNDVPGLSAEFGKFFTLTFDDNGNGSVETSDFGDPDEFGNLPFPLNPEDETASFTSDAALWWLLPLVGVLILAASVFAWRSKSKKHKPTLTIESTRPVQYHEMEHIEL